MINQPTATSNSAERFAGVLIGTAVGDALGLPAENLSPQRVRRLWKGEWRMRFVLGRGMVSDDTEHTLLVAQALLSESTDPVRFQKILAAKLRWWFAALPAGVGLATARACLKLWLGFRPDKAAVNSAGSGPAMRSAIIGAYFADATHIHRRRTFVLASSRLTHKSWQAETAALAVAECSAYAVTTFESPGSTFIDHLRTLSRESEWQNYLHEVNQAYAESRPVQEFASKIGLSNGITGYSIHVTIIAIYSWLLHWRDFRGAVTSVLHCGGDTDTAGAIVGAIAGAVTSDANIPEVWRSRLLEWPRSTKRINEIAVRLAEQQRSGTILGPVRYFWPAIPLRNIFFLIVVLLHGARRVLPPY